MIKPQDIASSVTELKQGAVIAYPTEAVYGLGCDPFSEQAVKRLLALKERSWQKGVLLIASDWTQIESLILPLSKEQKALLDATWPGPSTWVIPASDKVPVWIRGEHTSVALRITAHPIVRALCTAFGGPLVSTSANIATLPPAMSLAMLIDYFSDKLDGIVEGELGKASSPSSITDLLTGERLRLP